MYLGVKTLASSRQGLTPEPGSAGHFDLWRGVLVNALNPHPWLFWCGVGGPLLLEAWRAAPPTALGFLTGFYLMIVGSKAAIAALAARGRRVLQDRCYQRVLAVCGLMLLLLGGLLVWQAATSLAST
jgi:threonine/homoserine/homoserine lactone efflux protein